MKENWDKCFDLVMASEGGFSDDIRDKGNHMPDGRPGCTNLGVTMMTWEIYVQRQATVDEMRTLTREDVKPLYKKMFWDKVWGDRMPSGIDYLLFDFAVNAGPSRAILCLQEAVGAYPDGLIGPLTYAATVMHKPKELIELYTAFKEKFYINLHNATYEKGWLNRAELVKTTAETMVS